MTGTEVPGASALGARPLLALVSSLGVAALGRSSLASVAGNNCSAVAWPSFPRGEAGTIDPVVRLLEEEVERAGITLTPEQRTAILKILRELVDRDVRVIRELLHSIQGGNKEGAGL
jgi:hypothetical protein